MKFLRRLILMLVSSAVAAGVVLALRLPEMPVSFLATGSEATLSNDLEQALIKQVSPAELSQDRINASLAAKPPAEPLPLLSCALRQEECSLFLTWQVLGTPLVARVDLSVQREGAEFHVDILRGAYGHLRVPRGMLMPLRPVLEALQEHYSTELTALFAIPRFRFAQNKLVLDPRF